MLNREEIAKKIEDTGFSCKMCGECCTNQSEDSNLVLLSAPEIREIIRATGIDWDDIAEPYPEFFTEGDCEYTFAWCLKRKGKRCIFLGEHNRCKIYKNRPWICRTYPFMLSEDDLIISECKNCGCEISEKDALLTADALIERKKSEDMEFDKISRIYDNAVLFGTKICVIDSEGVKKIG